jgi:large subunit ribosomal protein L29
MRIAEIRDRSDGELRTLARQLSEDMYKLRAQRATNQLENTSAVRGLKKDLARVLTVTRARELKREDSKRDIVER